MALTAEKCEAFIVHTLGGPIGAPLSSLELINMCGEWFCEAHPWTFNRDRAVRLDVRPSITLTAATYTDATLTITETGAFADYSFVDGDIILDLAGTGVTTGQVEVASRTDDDNIVLTSSLGSAANGSSDLTGTLPNNTILLPSDLRNFDAIDAVDSGSSEIIDLMGLLDFSYNRTGRWSFETSHLKGVVVNVRPESGGAIVSMLEIDPDQSTLEEKLYLRYTSGWRDVTTSSEALPLPNDNSIDLVFLQALLTMARGWDKEDEAPMWVRMHEFQMSQMWRDAIGQDGSKQHTLGPISGSDVRRRHGRGRLHYDIRKET